MKPRSNHLDQRESSIYRNRRLFSIFGVGPYSFSPWKVVISSYYKHLNFRCTGPIEGKLVVLDDTCDFLPCQTEHDARTFAQLLNSHGAAKGFFRSFIFWDAKCPITAHLLASLDLERLGPRKQGNRSPYGQMLLRRPNPRIPVDVLQLVL